jgi:uncharacterized coiled-coil protein SlyX
MSHAWHNLSERVETLLINQDDTITELRLKIVELKREIDRLKKMEAQ